MKLADQDRGAWDRARIEEGQALLRECLARNRPGPYQLQAAINAVHSDAIDAAHTDWRQILALYDQWMALAPSPVVALNRAVAVAEIDGADSGAATGRWARSRRTTTCSTRCARSCCGSGARG